MKDRHYYLDNLRTFLIFLVVLFHAGTVYLEGYEGYMVSDPAKAEPIGLIGLYIDVFVMALIFFISGYFAPASMKGRSGGEFLKTKARRIMLPWFVAVLLLIPAYKAIWLVSNSLPQEPFSSYFHFFSRAGGNPEAFNDDPNQHWLWFLPVLFVFHLSYFALSKTRIRLDRVPVSRWVLVTLVVGIVWGWAFSVADARGWTYTILLDFQRERLLVYFLIFILGVVVQHQDALDGINENKKLYIWANVGLTIGLLVYTVTAINSLINSVTPDRDFYFISSVIDRLLLYAALMTSMLSFIHILLYSFKKKLNKAGSLARQLSADSYYVYIIHMVVLGGIAVLLLPLPFPAGVKYVVLALSSWIACHAIVYGARRALLLHK